MIDSLWYHMSASCRTYHDSWGKSPVEVLQLPDKRLARKIKVSWTGDRYKKNDKGKLPERVRRKVTGLQPLGHGSGIAESESS